MKRLQHTHEQLKLIQISKSPLKRNQLGKLGMLLVRQSTFQWCLGGTEYWFDHAAVRMGKSEEPHLLKCRLGEEAEVYIMKSLESVTQWPIAKCSWPYWPYSHNSSINSWMWEGLQWHEEGEVRLEGQIEYLHPVWPPAGPPGRPLHWWLWTPEGLSAVGWPLWQEAN